MYPSDYAYAVDLNTCTLPGIFWSSSEGCQTTNWLYQYNEEETKRGEWTLMTYLDIDIPAAGAIDYYSIRSSLTTALMTEDFDVRPTVYLKSNVIITGGIGTRDNPYKLKLGKV